ncbi:hypothetical protein [Klebsiella pneumoniae]|uniref:hypothetical protein n=1 Tax=Klebsiella pneumoniae TaxID=573 RepID=UPI0022702B5B|nr:hypothetical protein [Klebsiella pneumoniae]MCY0155225.1 hypothetical protein [Klebsiella pneumoniae]
MEKLICIDPCDRKTVEFLADKMMGRPHIGTDVALMLGGHYAGGKWVARTKRFGALHPGYASSLFFAGESDE